MRYLLVDRVTKWNAGESINGVKNVAMTEDFLEFHFPKSPVMPGVLLLEAMAQLAGWLRAASSDFGEWFLLQRVDKCKFYGFALPGDQIEIEVKALDSIDGIAGASADTSPAAASTASFSAVGFVNGKKKVVAEFSGIVTPLGELEEMEEQRRFFNILTRQLQL
ncbi:MAG: beta-hydroxyacyl-ACP dehydratase [Nitrospirae bacterium]|nr:beta-hydroxyacyl-ACP dehydratase [Nitrospirota bacterium]